jgi:hypothetical protein
MLQAVPLTSCEVLLVMGIFQGGLTAGSTKPSNLEERDLVTPRLIPFYGVAIKTLKSVVAL